MSAQEIRKRDWLQLTLRMIIGGIFIYAAVPKILAPGEFYLSILGYDLITGPLAKLAALWIPWLELIGAIGVIFGIWYLANLRIVQVLLGVFVVILLLTLIRGIQTDCGCFGHVLGRISWWHVVGDLILLLMTTFLISWAKFVRYSEASD